MKDMFAFAEQAVSIDIKSSTWRGVSGETPSGVEVAEHLVETSRYVQRVIWEGTFSHDLLDAFRAVRAEGVGDEDTQSVGRDLMSQILAVHLSGWVDVDAWAGKPGRDWTDVLYLVLAAADLARTYGPAKAVTS
ncbi:hypothetical protein OG747_36535 [Streptomyces sp. NBC_01384]|uniref:DUF6197 family protein n=1 Tax=Streptomyces sp. NBC_01384 TaxID=2903847 RepID=UPI003243747C